MRVIISVAILFFVFVACKKTVFTAPKPPAPEMQVTLFNNVSAGMGQSRAVDLDGNGTNDIYFSFQLVGDPIMQADKHQFYASGGFYTWFPVDPAEDMPALQNGREIGPGSFPGYEWYNASSIMLAQKILTATNPPYWTGAWKNNSHTYFPFYLLKADKKYFGWFEISFDMTTEKIILHRAAVSKEADRAVKAGSI